MHIELIELTLSILHNQTFLTMLPFPKTSRYPQKDNRGHPKIHQLNEQERREAMEKKEKYRKRKRRKRNKTQAKGLTRKKEPNE